jgi:hypothetical protein
VEPREEEEEEEEEEEDKKAVIDNTVLGQVNVFIYL